MKTYQKKKHKFYFLYLLLIIIFFVSFYFFKTKTSLITKYLSFPYVSLNGFINNYQTLKKDSKLVDNLTKENSYLKANLKKYNTLEEEIEILKKQLDLKSIYTSYEVINATLINKSYLLNNFTIDKGKDYNLKEGMAVLSGDNLIGKITNVYDYTSTISLITNNDTKTNISVGVKTTEGYKHGLITSYDNINNYLVVEGITSYDKVAINSKVVTTGLGSFPEGLLIGYVKDITLDSSKISKILHVSFKEDLTNLKYVLVLGEKTND